MLQLKNELGTGLEWTNYVTETLFLNYFQLIFGILVLQFLATADLADISG